ncbi:MAG: 16S rRNA (uracil(1498)-N(3))-methyltransferase [Candidatus Omnitrophica bacterium]|nr:16S rRNA (uracil(1498)-N(3))-methyltransferase [Candidatus Omnitrophota bacterium]
MHRVFCLNKNISHDRIVVDSQDDVHHFKNVLWLEPGEKITAVDEQGNEYLCVIETMARNATLKIIQRTSVRPASCALTVACALAKNAKIDEVIEKLTQLGVVRIIPLHTERVIVKIAQANMLAKQKRWQRIAKSAALQSQRNTVPAIDAVTDIKQVIAESKNYDVKLIPTLSGKREGLKEVLGNLKLKNILVLIGPEGDFTDNEVARARNAGFIPISLGQHVLRVDTAAIAVASFISLYENS